LGLTKEEVRRRILEVGICPVVRAATPSHAIAASEAVCAGGIPVVEITMTVPGAIDVIAELSKTMGGEVLVGAGTVLNAETARKCIDAGAQFLVSPGFDLETVKLANRESKLIMAGSLTPTEVITAWNAGADFVKIFPCGNLGGASYIKALKGPLPQIPMIPTGGVNLHTAADFIRAGSAALGIGGELVSPAALNAGNMALITDTARQFVSIVREARQPDKVATAAK
jgi:2-dehydro-3-deoxyphosphogluconate aldolase / (4S)-4-hydroxy-2-oxoglutarate aldolase